MKELIGSRMAELPEKEQLVLVLYYYEDLTLKEIGEILDVTESRVCQIHTRAIMRLKGKIDRHEGKSSIGQITRQIRRRQEETDRQDELEPTPTNVKAVYQENDRNTDIQGTTSNYVEIGNWEIELGRIFTEEEVEDAAPVAVIGETIRKELFGEGVDPIGSKIRLKNMSVEVIGVTKVKYIFCLIG